jgi:hypothetical protein
MDILLVLNSLRPGESITFNEGSDEDLSNVIWINQTTYTSDQDVSNINVSWNEEANVYTETPFIIPTQHECEDYWNSTLKNELGLKSLRRKRNTILEQSDRYATTDFPYGTEEDKQARLTQRQTLRDLPTLVTPLEGGSMKLWVTNQNGPLQAGDSLVTSNVAGYFTKGAPAVVTITGACDFSASTTETYYSNIASVTESNVVTTSETPQEGYTENAYWTSNSVSYYTGNVVTHYSNVVVYDGVNVHTNVQVAEYSNLTVETQGNYTAVSVSQDSVEEVEGYTPVLSYSNVTSDRYDANVHTDYVKVVNHYSNVSVVETVAYSNIAASTYEALDSNAVVTPGYTSFFHEVSNTSILVGAYAQLTPTQRTEYTINTIEPVTSNLQSFYTPQTKTVTHEIKDVGDHIAAHVECTFPSP